MRKGTLRPPLRSSNSTQRSICVAQIPTEPPYEAHNWKYLQFLWFQANWHLRLGCRVSTADVSLEQLLTASVTAELGADKEEAKQLRGMAHAGYPAVRPAV